MNRYVRRPRGSTLVWLGFALVWMADLDAAQPKTLPNTDPLDWPEEDLSSRLMDGAHRFVERKIDETARRRQRYWQYGGTSPKTNQPSIEENRQQLREILGVVDSRAAPRMERYGDEQQPALVAETPSYRVFQVRWAVLEGVYAEGLLAQPRERAVAHVVALPDADQTPEQLLGLQPGLDAAQQVARRLAERGVEVVVPLMINRQLTDFEDPRLRRSQQTWREWIYRQAFHMGRHIIGYEVEKVLAAVDWFKQRQQPTAKIGVTGYAEGGLVAFYAAAIDPRIDVALVSGYFDDRQRIWSEPIYRNVWGLLKRFGDAEIASLILPRQLVVEHSVVPAVSGHKGDWNTPSWQSVQNEFKRIPVPAKSPKPILIHNSEGGTVGPWSPAALEALAVRLGLVGEFHTSHDGGADRRRDFDSTVRHRRSVQQLEDHVQRLVRRSEHVRDRFFLYTAMPELTGHRWSTAKQLPHHSADKFVQAALPFRERFRTDAMGEFDERLIPPRPRTRKILETDQWTAWDVVLDVYPELFSWGVLLLPKDLKPGERRPVVVCQHGRQGLPRDTIDQDHPAYNNFAARLAERGFITFAPHNLYRGEDRYRWLDRKANSVGATLFSFIIAQHDQMLNWLSSLPQVDPDRIAFYGLSYGGETAVRVPTILQRYCLSICSGDYNQWTRKVAATDQPFSFMGTIEWEMPYWNLGHTFDYAEMTYLMIPRPFMVERGHLDLVGRDRWVAHEYAKARWLYAQLGLADRTEIEFFQGGHSIQSKGTFAFLHKHLDWPEP